MNGFEINTPRSKIAAMPENERVLFLLLGHLANEISILRKLFFFCGHAESANKWQSRANNAQALVMARVLIGKLREGWKLLQQYFFGAKLSKEYDSFLSEKEKESLSNLKKYFGKDNIVKNLRDNFSFHYSDKNMTEAFGKTSENEPDNWQIYIGDNVGNSLFFMSEYVVNNALLESILPGNEQEAMDKLFKESTEVASWFTEVISGCMNVITEKYLLNDKGELEVTAVDVGSVQAMDEIHVPYFVSAPHAT